MQLVREFSLEPESVASVRSFVRDTMRDAGREATMDDVVLVASELATNALRHGGTPFTLTVDLVPGERARLSVTDGGDGTPRVTDAAANDISHRGLAIVAALGRWGVDWLEPGKRVWWEHDQL